MMNTYFDKKTGTFVEQVSKTKSANKILITEEILKANKKGTYGGDGNVGQYYSTISKIDFLWDDLNEILVDTCGNNIRVRNPRNPEDYILI